VGLMSVEFRLSRVDRVYRAGETLNGCVVVSTEGPLSHNGIQLILTGDVSLQLSTKSVGIFEAFYNAIKPIQLMSFTVQVAKAGKIPDGVTELPFEFKLEPISGQILYETYHGVYVNIQYSLQCDVFRPLLTKNLQKKLEFIMEQEVGKQTLKEVKLPFSLLPSSLEHVKKSVIEAIPDFKVSGFLTTATSHIGKPFTGEIVIDSCEAPIKSIELQLVRVETCGCADGYAKEATEIQNIQIADGDVCRTMAMPIYMVFPRLFTCPTLAAKTFKIEFEVNLVILLENGHLITENFPIRIYR